MVASIAPSVFTDLLALNLPPDASAIAYHNFDAVLQLACVRDLRSHADSKTLIINMGKKNRADSAKAAAPAGKPSALQVKKLEDDVNLALATPTAYSSPFRFTHGNLEFSVDRHHFTMQPQDDKTLVDVRTRPQYIPAPVVTDLLNYSTRDRAVHWLSRVLVRDTSCMVLQIEICKYYHQCWAPHARPDESMQPAELLDLLLKIFKGSRKDTIPGKRVGDAHEFVMRNVAWRGQPSFAEMGLREEDAVDQAMFSLDLGSTGFPKGAPLDTPFIPATGWPDLTLHDAQPVAIAPSIQAPAADPSMEYDDHIPIRLLMTFADKCAGRKLAHLPEPARTRYWLRMFYERGSNVEMEEASMWLFYEQTFKPYYDISPHLDDVQFVKRITKVFRNAEEVEVAPEKHVIWGIKPREKRRKASVLLKKYAEEEYKRTVFQLHAMDARDDFDLRVPDSRFLNKFQERLLVNPLLSLPADKPSPWLERLRRRARGEPLGDYQPGFPGVSMKRLASEYRRDYEDARRQANETVNRAAAGEPDAVAAVAKTIDDVVDRFLPPEGSAESAAPYSGGEDVVRQFQGALRDATGQQLRSEVTALKSGETLSSGEAH